MDDQLQLAWLRLGIALQTERSLVQFPIRAHAWVAAPARAQPIDVSHVDTSLPLSPSLLLSLKPKIKIKFKKKEKKMDD